MDDDTGIRDYQDEGAVGTAKILWAITRDGALFTYRYTILLPEAGAIIKEVSHFTLDLSNDFTSSGAETLCDNVARNTPDGFNPDNENGVEFGDMDGLAGAMPFDFGGGQSEEGVINTLVGLARFYEFTVNRAPVCGNYAIRTGQDLFQNPGPGRRRYLAELGRLHRRP